MFLAACGGSDTSDESGAPTVAASTSAETTGGETSTAAEEELLYGCIEPGTAKPLSIESAGATLDAAVFGKGPVGIVLAHESDGSLCNWASIAPEFANAGYRVLIFDFGEPATAARPRSGSALRSTAFSRRRPPNGFDLQRPLPSP